MRVSSAAGKVRALRERRLQLLQHAHHANPDSAPERGSLPSRMHSMKWAHSIRSGSSFEIRGEETSPERAMYSPYDE